MNKCEFSESGDNMYSIDTAIVLAGGNSKRMGIDKQFISMGSKNITEYIIDELKELFSNVVIVTNKAHAYKRTDIDITEDIYKGIGPLGGIHAGLMKSKSRYSYVVACDMPCINKDYIRYMVKKLEKSKYSVEAVITKYGDWIEPFNAIYSKDLLPRIEAGIFAEKKKISGLLKLAKVLYIEEEDARRFSPDWRMFMNLNTEKDLMVYRAIKQEDMYGAYQTDSINEV